MGPDGKPIFLFMIDSKILGQFPLEPSFLERALTVQHIIKYALEHLEKKGRHYAYKKKCQGTGISP